MGQFPPAGLFAPPNVLDAKVDIRPNQPGLLQDNWAIEILPFIDNGRLVRPYRPHPADRVEYEHGHGDGRHDEQLGGAGPVLPFMLCPSDSFNRRPFNGVEGNDTVSWFDITKFNDGWARGNYAINFGLGDLTIHDAPADLHRNRRHTAG